MKPEPIPRPRLIPGLAALALTTLLAGVARAQGPVIRESDSAQAVFGWSVATAGDVNKDGYKDLIVGAPGYSNGQTREGAAYVFLGGVTGIASQPVWIVEGNQAGAALGTSVSAAGDVNGDGFGDVVVGAPAYDNGEVDEGRAYVFHGQLGGLSSTPAWTGEGNQAGARYGTSVGGSTPAAAVDIAANGNQGLWKSFDGDVFADVVVGAPFYDNGQADEGRAFLYRGGPQGLATAAAWTAESDQAGARFGGRVAAAGLTNGDTYGDLAVAAMYWDAADLPESGKVYVYFGTPNGPSPTAGWTKEGDAVWGFFGGSVASAGDVNGDGLWDLLVGAWSRIPPQNQDDVVGRATLYLGTPYGPSSQASWTRDGVQAYSNHAIAVASAGKSNFDPYSDVVVGAPQHDGERGRIEVFYGGPAGLPAQPSWTADSGRDIAQYGYSVSSSGDLNKDGRSDLVVGAPAYEQGQSREGAVYVYPNPPPAP